MATSFNPFIGLPLATLQTLQSEYIAAVRALAVSSGYTLNGRSVTRSELTQVMAALGQINAAIADAEGNTTNSTLVSFTGL